MQTEPKPICGQDVHALWWVTKDVHEWRDELLKKYRVRVPLGQLETLDDDGIALYIQVELAWVS